MLHESFANWYLYLHELNGVKCQESEKNEFTVFYAKCYAYKWLDQSGKDVYVNDIFTRENYEMLSKYMHGLLSRNTGDLREACPEWTFVISEFHNFVIEHEMGTDHAMRKRKVARGGGGFGEVHDALLQYEDGGSLLPRETRLKQEMNVSDLLVALKTIHTQWHAS